MRRRARWRGRRGWRSDGGGGIDGDDRRSERKGTAAISRTAAPELDSEHLEGEGRTADRMVVVERRGELSSAGGDGSRRRGGFGFSGTERERERKLGDKRERGEGEHGDGVLSTQIGRAHV